MSDQNNKRLIYKVSINTILVNLILTVIKLLAGIFGCSVAMISDAIHSGSDVLSTIVVMIGVKVSNKKADKNHPYGYEKFECVASLVLSLMLFCTAASIGYCGIKVIIEIINGKEFMPHNITIWTAAISIVVKEWMYHYTIIVARRVDSVALYADAWHHRSDALSSIGALVGIIGSKIFIPILDPIASLVICGLIIKVSYDILMTSLRRMIDTSAPEIVEEEIMEIIKRHKDIENIDMLKTRLFGNRIYVDIEVRIDKNMSFSSAHALVHKLHDEIEKDNKLVKHCMIHANPTE